MMHTAEALQLIAPLRRDAIVISGRGSRHWVKLSERPSLDAPLGDPAMGGHAGFALGLALAQPDKQVILLDSEGDILMSLGMLPTIAEQAPANFYHFLLDNEVYDLSRHLPDILTQPGAVFVALQVLPEAVRPAAAPSRRRTPGRAASG